MLTSLSRNIIGTIIVLAINSIATLAQNSDIESQTLLKMDSIKSLITPHLSDGEKAIKYLEIGKLSFNNDTSIKYCQLAIRHATESEQQIVATASQVIGTKYYMKHQPLKALPYLENCANIFKQLGSKEQLAQTNVNMAECYEIMNMPESVFEHINRAIEICTELKDTSRLSYAYLKMGGFYINHGFCKEAEQHINKACELDSLSGNYLDMACDIFWIGYMYVANKDYNKSIQNLTHSINIFNAHKSEHDILYYSTVYNLALIYKAEAYINMASDTNEQRFADSCKVYMDKCDTFFERQGQWTNYITDRFTHVKYLSFIGKYSEAIKLLSDCEKHLIGDEQHKEYHQMLSYIYEKIGNYKDAFEHQKRQFEYAISYLNDSTLNASADAKTGQALQTERLKQKHIEELHEAETSKLTIVITSLSIVLLLVSLLVVVIYIMFKNKRKANRILARQNHTLDEQKEEIETQNERLVEQNKIISEINYELTDSINYAKRIQNSILPDLQSIINNELNGFFTIYRPLKTVSGDFYWARRHQNGKLIFVCADCTGHGVPGAFMSMIGTALLNDICSNSILPSSGDILTHLDAQLQIVIGQNEDNSIQDGIDLALIIIDPKTLQLTYSTARRPIYIWHNNNLIEYKGTKRSIGDKEPFYQKNAFTTTELQLDKGDIIYMFTDGITDIFGKQQPNSDSLRLQLSGVLSIIEQSAKLNIDQQASYICNSIDKWQGTCQQVDDITMMGIEI